MNNKTIEIDWGNNPRKEAVSLAKKYFGFDQVNAEFYVSVARGEIRGDVINVDDMNESERKLFGSKDTLST